MRRRIWLVVVVFVIGAVGRSEGADAPTDAVEKDPRFCATLRELVDGRAANTVYHAAAGEVAAGLGSEWTSREFTTGETAHTTVSRPGAGPVVRVTAGISDAVGYEVRFWIDGH